MTCGTVTGVKVLDAEEHILSLLWDRKGETNITACLRNSIVSILVIAFCTNMDSVSLPFSAMCSSLSKQPLMRLPEVGQFWHFVVLECTFYWCVEDWVEPSQCLYSQL